jgi:hemerythrin superfamily protein
VDIYQRLKQDHDAVRRLFERLAACPSRAEEERSALFATLRQDLMAHLLAEQEVFYDTLLARSDEQDLLLESVEVHGVVERLLDEIEAGGPGDERFETRVSELKGLVEQHVAQEESLVFETARKHLPAAEALELGDEMKARKKENR